MAHPRPIYRIRVDGENISAVLDGRLMNLTLTDNRGFEADQLDLTLDDADGKLALPPKGAEIAVAIGWEDEGLTDKGIYTVDDIEHDGAPDKLTIRARSADLRSGLSTQRERSWHATTVGEIVKTLAEENDLEPTVSAELATKAIEHEDQTNESAVNFLTRLAGKFDAVATVKAGRLLFIHAGAGLTASGKRIPAVTIKRESGDRHRFAIADRQTYSHVRATWNDVGRAEKGEILWGKDDDAAEKTHKAPPAKAPEAPVKGELKPLGKTAKNRHAALRAAKKEWKRIKAIPAMKAKYSGVKASYDDKNLKVKGEVSYGQADDEKAGTAAAKTAAQDAAKIKAQTAPSVTLDHGPENTKTLRHVYASKESAKRAARAEWRRLQRGMATFGITLARGRADLMPEMPATVSGWKPQIDSTDWIITRVTHSLDDNGYTTGLELEIKATEVAVENS